MTDREKFEDFKRAEWAVLGWEAPPNTFMKYETGVYMDAYIFHAFEGFKLGLSASSAEIASLHEEVKRMRLGLRNCLALITRQVQASQFDRELSLPTLAEHIERFCSDAGVTKSMLRDIDNTGGQNND